MNSWLLGACGVAALVGVASAEPVVFVSEDGLRRVERAPGDGAIGSAGGGATSGGFSSRVGVPFPAQPNWTYVERRAVGAVRIGDLNNRRAGIDGERRREVRRRDAGSARANSRWSRRCDARGGRALGW
jgi:hypothetical protein